MENNEEIINFLDEEITSPFFIPRSKTKKVEEGLELDTNDRIGEGVLEILPDDMVSKRSKLYLSTPDDYRHITNSNKKTHFRQWWQSKRVLQEI